MARLSAALEGIGTNSPHDILAEGVGLIPLLLLCLVLGPLTLTKKIGILLCRTTPRDQSRDQL
jgi:hypothetical protein